MKTKRIIFPVICCLLFACSEQKQDSVKPADETKNAGADTPDTKNPSDNAVRQFIVRPGTRILFTETHPVGMSMSDVEIKWEGGLSGDMAFRDIDPVADILEGDLDNNSLKEWYIISSSAGTGGYGQIKAIAHMEDDRIDEILIPDMNAGEGYGGHDEFSIRDGKLVRRFPLYSKGDSQSRPTGGEKTISYTLIQFPGGKYALDPVK